LAHKNFEAIDNATKNAGVAKSVDATDLDEKLSAHRETFDAELLKFGETLQAGERPMAIPSQA